MGAAAGWVTMMMDGCNCSKGEERRPSSTAQTKQTNKQTIKQSFSLLFPCGLIVSISSFINSPITTLCEQFPPVSINQKFLGIFAIYPIDPRLLMMMVVARDIVVVVIVRTWFGLVGSLFGSLDVQYGEHISCKACGALSSRHLLV